MDATLAATALIDEACRRSSLLWLNLPAAPHPRPAWHLWRDGAVHVVTGPGEQSLPELRDAQTTDVIVRSKDNGGRLLRWEASVTALVPGTSEWDAVVPELAAKRLNAPDRPQVAQRWADSCTVFRLTPTGRVTERARVGSVPPTLSSASQARPAPPTSATTRGPLPWRLGRNSRFRRWFGRRQSDTSSV